MNSLKLNYQNPIDFRHTHLNEIEVISVFDQDSNKTFQQIIEDAFTYLLNSGIDNRPASRYTNINSR